MRLLTRVGAPTRPSMMMPMALRHRSAPFFSAVSQSASQPVPPRMLREAMTSTCGNSLDLRGGRTHATRVTFAPSALNLTAYEL